MRSTALPLPAQRPVQRVLVYGVTGSGKSTLAARVARRTGLPHVSVDDLTWRPGWVALPEDEQRALFTQVCAQDRWVLDSAYGSWVDVPLARADVVVGLDLPRHVSLLRLVRRTMRRVLRHERVCGGNTETLRQALSRESILLWHWHSFAGKRARLLTWESEPDGPPVLRLTSRAQVERWVRSL